MRKYILLLFIGCFIHFSYGQVTNSVLSTGDWFKFSVDTTGVFRIDKNLLQQIGVNTNGLNPKKIHIYGNGGALLPVVNNDFRFDDLQENAIFVRGESDGVFNDDDFILFYAKGPHDWQIDPETQVATHRHNIFSDESYYFITVNDADGKRIQNKAPVQATSNTIITTFNDFVVIEKDERNLLAAGTQWFYNTDLNIVNSQRFNIPFPNPVSTENLTINTRAVTNNTSASFIDVNVNGSNLYRLNFLRNNSTFDKARTVTNSGNFVSNANNINVSFTYNSSGNPSANAFLDYIEVIGKKELIATNKQFSFRSFDQFNANQPITYQVRNANNISQIWDVTDFLNPTIINNQGTGANFRFNDVAGQFKEYIVLNDRDYFTPTVISNSKVNNQNLHALKDINYLIITVPELANQAQRLADYHQENSNLTTRVVTLEEIYNEFSSGSKDITGIRDFIKHLFTTNTNQQGKLKFACFFGDGSFDYKERTPGNNNIVPVKLAFSSFNLTNSFVTDDFFVMLDDNEGAMNSVNHTVDVATGRIPVSTDAQARDVVDKILNYYSESSIGDWRNTVTLLADDTDAPTDAVLQTGVESIAEEIKQNKPSFNIDKIYIDAFVQEVASGGERYPEVNELITNSIEKGTLVLDYFGHGGEDGFAAERIFDKPQIQALNNFNTLPLLITVTCDFSRFDNPNRITAGELTLWNKNGGAANMITTTREVFITTGQRFNEDLIKVLLEFNNEDLTIAESLMRVKNNFSSFQKFFIYNFGDPAMKLAVPDANIRITKMNGKDVSQPLDTLKALSRVRFEGVVVDKEDKVLTDFNGTLSTTVFDKTIDNTTLDNGGFGNVLVFDTQDSKLFRGKSTVQNGVFNFEFIVPRDIRIATGNAKLSFYAENGSLDRAGFNKDIIVGGINPNAPDDTVGPSIQLFANDESFIDGGTTNSSPNIIINLSDESGINTSITSIGHNIEGVLDGDVANPIVLNDFYETELNDFTKGKATFKLRNLEEGPHSFKIKAWDTYNNSSEATLNFDVISDAVLKLENVLNYPNPFVNYTEFWFNHNKPNEPLEVQVQIFTVSGKLVKTINQNVQTTSTLSRNITWNGLDDFGNKIGKGVYIYKLKVKSTISNLVSEKYEKLVILQ